MTDIERIKEALDDGKILKAYYLLQQKLSNSVYEEGFKTSDKDEVRSPCRPQDLEGC